MPVDCCVKDCPSMNAAHRLPTNEERRALWIAAIGLTEDPGTKDIRICGNHFCPEDFQAESMSSSVQSIRSVSMLPSLPSRQNLKNTAVPTRFLSRPAIHMDGVQLARDVRRSLDDMIAGQDTAKTRMTGVITLGIMSRMNKGAQEHAGIALQKSNILIFGPSGTGKTMLAKSLCAFLDVPASIVDCTMLTRAGYAGRNVESVVSDLLVAANGNVEAAQSGVIFLDEIDCLRAAESSPQSSAMLDVAGRDVQKSFLKLLEGKRVRVPKPAQERKHVTVDTTNVIFIGIGVFPGLQRQESTSAPTKADFIRYGMMRELMGRFTSLVPFEAMDAPTMVKAMSLPSSSLLEELKLKLRFFNVDATFTDAGLLAIAHEALELSTGARGLKDVFNRIFDAILPDILNEQIKITAVEIAENALTRKVDILYKDEPAASAMELGEAAGPSQR